MRRGAFVILVAMSVASGARAAHPTTESCSPVSCVRAHAQVDLGCGADGRDPSSCLGTVQYVVSFDSPVPVESMDYSVAVSCTTTCDGARTVAGRCGWAPPEIRPIGETGCEIADIAAVTFTAEVPPGFCAVYQVTAAIDVRLVLDPLARAHHDATDFVHVCG